MPDKKDYDYGNADLLEKYNGTHPAVFETRIKNAQWNFIYDKRKFFPQNYILTNKIQYNLLDFF